MLEMPARSDPFKNKLRLQSVSRIFRTPHGSLTALEDFSLEIPEGEFLCIVGPSGCGKSTLLNLIAGLDRPTSGEIWKDSRRVNGPGTDRIIIFRVSWVDDPGNSRTTAATPYSTTTPSGRTRAASGSTATSA